MIEFIIGVYFGITLMAWFMVDDDLSYGESVFLTIFSPLLLIWGMIKITVAYLRKDS